MIEYKLFANVPDDYKFYYVANFDYEEVDGFVDKSILDNVKIGEFIVIDDKHYCVVEVTWFNRRNGGSVKMIGLVIDTDYDAYMIVKSDRSKKEGIKDMKRWRTER